MIYNWTFHTIDETLANLPFARVEESSFEKFFSTTSFSQEAMSNLPNAIRDLPAFMERLMGNHAGIDQDDQQDDQDEQDDQDDNVIGNNVNFRLGATRLAGGEGRVRRRLNLFRNLPLLIFSPIASVFWRMNLPTSKPVSISSLCKLTILFFFFWF